MLLLSALLMVALAVLLVACGADRPLHILSDSWSKDAQKHWHACTDQGCPYKDDLSYHDFELVSISKDATCTTTGEGRYRCSVCQFEKTDVIPLKEHDYQLEEAISPATCIGSGVGRFKCANCESTTYMTLPATGQHVFDGACVSMGEEGHCVQCSTPGCTALDELQPHVAGEVVTEEMTDWNDGYTRTLCKDCNDVINEVITYNPHAPVDFDIQLTPPSGAPLTFVPRESEDGIEAYDVNIEYYRTYTLKLVNAVNGLGNSITIADGDIRFAANHLWGLFIYTIGDRGDEESINNLGVQNKSTGLVYNTEGGNSLQFLKKSEEPVRLIFSFETGINDVNYHNRKIRVRKIVYFRVVSQGSLASAASEGELNNIENVDVYAEDKKSAIGTK